MHFLLLKKRTGGRAEVAVGFLADLWLWTLSGTCALMLEPILDLAQVTPWGGGLMAHFARHTELLGPAQTNLLSQHSSLCSRSYTQSVHGEKMCVCAVCAGMWQHASQHTELTKTATQKTLLSIHVWGWRLASCQVVKQISCSHCNVVLYYFDTEESV